MDARSAVTTVSTTFSELVRSVLDERGTTADAWESAVGEFWGTAVPSGQVLRAHGWKLHVSSARACAPAVLKTVARIAAAECCAFKYAAGMRELAVVNSRDCDRGSVGKFITLYPRDDAHLVALAHRIHAATAGLPGPVVLSDRPYRPGSLVHYRYGGFGTAAGREVSPDGVVRTVLTGPGGERVEDRRGPRCVPPPWADDPFGNGHAADGGGGGRPVLLGGRYLLGGALRHGAKGGVYLGTDTVTGEDVVVKAARPHVEVDASGRDACAALRHEARMLGLLAAEGLAPRPLGLLDGGGRLFLVQEKVPGTTLAAWAAARAGRDGPGVPWTAAGPVARALVELLRAVHGWGLVLGDLAPGNVLVRPDGALRVVDLELTAYEGDGTGGAGTPGYRAPERSAAGATDAADRRADLFALGGLLFLLSTGEHPPGAGERGARGAGRAAPERLGPWLASAARHGGTAAHVGVPVLGLRQVMPGRRWPLARVRSALEGTVPAGAGRPSRARPVPSRAGRGRPAAAQEAVLDRLLADGVAHLAATATPHRHDRLWPVVPGGERTDPRNVQHGAAGVLGLLARAAVTEGLPEEVRATARATARVAADWIVQRPGRAGDVLPGLYFGGSGVAWALLDAAEALGDPGLAECGASLAAGVPVRWPNPDVCHGAAGAGLLLLRAGLTERAEECARGLLAGARESRVGVLWPVPGDFDSAFAGTAPLGYGHGVAGIGAFLLAAAGATGERAFLDAARRAGRTLAATARTDGGSGTAGVAAWWPQGVDDAPEVRLAHWCAGSAGVGTFLVRLWRATGDEEVRDLAVAAGEAVLRDRWRGGTAFCHGLAGSGELLLDLARVTGAERWLAGAREVAGLLAVRRTVRQGRLVPLDETGRGCGTGYGTGIAGVLGFLLRVRHGGCRLWEPVSGESRRKESP
ncbi:class IV lanthionine synthetase LanL [Streptomyces cinnamoneus]|uniref:class IV lanthionine synthetase LanL n=1 Tax=Streptomyces cinnamoneus TaxID=53446 RepID=UPI003441FCB5